MVKESVTDEIILFPVVSTNEDDRKSPDRSLAICRFNTIRLLVYEGEGRVVPASEMLEEPALLFVGESGQYSANANVTGTAVFAYVVTVVEIVLIDNRTTVETFRSQHKFERFADGGLSNVIPADQQCVLLKLNATGNDSTKVLDLKSANSHPFIPLSCKH